MIDLRSTTLSLVLLPIVAAPDERLRPWKITFVISTPNFKSNHIPRYARLLKVMPPTLQHRLILLLVWISYQKSHIIIKGMNFQ